MNTAQLRSKAYDAEQARDYAGAATLYQQALESYPPHHPGSQLAIADKKSLECLAKSCRHAASIQVAA